MIDTTKKIVISTLIFLFPLFFLPLTQEYYLTNKWYLLLYGVLILTALTTINFIITKKITLRKTPFDGALFLILVTSTISLLLMSPNKVQGFLNPITGVGILYILSLFYFLVTQSGLHKRENMNQLIHNALTYSSIVLSVITIIFFFNPFKNVKFPLDLQFLSSPLFSPMGITLDLALFLGFFLVQTLIMMMMKNKKSSHEEVKKDRTFQLNAFSLVVVAIALALSIFTLIKPIPGSGTNNTPKVSIINSLPPYSNSWYTAIDTLKKPLPALFGVGPDNYAAAWTRSKTSEYNQNAIWQTNFDRASSLFLHILTEYGILGIVALVLLILYAIRSVFQMNHAEDIKRYFIYSLAYLVAVMILFPPSLPVIFLFFVLLMQIANEQPRHEEAKALDLSAFLPVVLGISLISLIVTVVVAYFLGRTYVAEYYFKRSLNSFAQNNARDTYLYQQKAILANNLVERYRVNFSQLNMLLANNLASSKKDKLTDEDKQNINQAIQAAISEAKAAVALNPQKATNWENLAIIYRNILNVAEGADSWTVSAYQRAILLDPSNPALRLNLGGIFYSLGAYSDAIKIFEQAVSLKPDWSNAHYNLAWASYQAKDVQRAVQEMQNVLVLINNPKSEDYKLAQKDLEKFKKDLPKEEAKPETKEGAKPKELSIPTPPAQTISPKLELPKEASPEANPE